MKLMNLDDPKRTVFLLHYHPLVREGLVQLIDLQPDLSVCGEATDFIDAVTEVAGLHPDITIVDSLLLNDAENDLISNLTRLAPTTKVVVLSSWENEEDAKQALLDGARGYTSRTTQIVSAIRRVLEGKLFPSDGLSDALVA